MSRQPTQPTDDYLGELLAWVCIFLVVAIGLVIGLTIGLGLF